MRKVAIIPNENKDKNLAFTRHLIDYLLLHDAEVFLSEEFTQCKIEKVKYQNSESFYDGAEFVITIGGDGTILRVAESVSEYSIPVIGINLGRMGFLAELEPNEIHLLERIFNDKYVLDKRMMLDVSVIRSCKEIYKYRALNDIVVSNGSIAKMAELDLYCLGTYVSSFHSDGIIISTPTGSTAYSLSAGGTIIEPAIDCMLFTPVCPHSFCNSRPMIFSSKSSLEVKNIQQNDDNTYLTVDGKFNQKLMYSDVVKVVASDKTVNLIKIKDKLFS